MSDLNQVSIEYLISMLATQAAAAMGAIPVPGQDDEIMDLNAAKTFIDMLGVIEEKTKGNLSEREAKMLEQTTHHIRMLYLQKVDEQKSKVK